MAKKTAVIPSLTKEEVKHICMGWENASKSGMGESVRGSFSQGLAGQTLELIFDDFNALTYVVELGEKISWSDNGKDFKDEYAQILELDTAPEIFIMNHLRAGTFPLENITLVIDVKTRLITLICAKLGNAHRPRDVERTFHFGFIKSNDSGIMNRHNYTTELVGKIIDWSYDNENQFIVKHLYMNNEHMVYLLLEAELKEKGLVEAAECDYIKIRENIYIMSWLEKGHQGMQGVALIDIKALHDVGSFFGININNILDNFTFAAHGKISDMGCQII